MTKKGTIKINFPNGSELSIDITFRRREELSEETICRLLSNAIAGIIGEPGKHGENAIPLSWALKGSLPNG
jgi:hypothetical protein